MTTRLYVDTESWRPEEEEFSFLLALLPLEAQLEVKRYLKSDDRKRALVSRLLARHVVSKESKVSHLDVNISSTKGGKKFTLNPSSVFSPNFNFNVSHDGAYTVIASEPTVLCGVDLCAPLSARRDVTLEWLRSSFANQLSTQEWADVEASGATGGKAALENTFQRLWALKESFVKARGDGLGFSPLSRIEFTLSRLHEGEEAYEASAKMDGIPLNPSRWKFRVEALDATGSMPATWVAVALGPPEEVIDEWGVFKGTFRQPELSDVEMLVRQDSVSCTS
jgi:4'-phosphopantetheinyl transferase